MDNKGSRVKMAKKLDQLNQIDKNIGRFTPLPLNIWYDEASEVLEKFPLVGFKWRFTNSPAGMKAKLAITNQRSDKDTIVEGQ